MGRLFNVLGEAIDGGEPLKDAPEWVIHREPPAFEDQNPAEEILETGIKVIDLWHHMQKVVRLDCSVEPE